MDLTGSVLTAPVIDDGEELGDLLIDTTDAANGNLELTLSLALYTLLGRYSTWRLREDTVFRAPLMQGRLVKAK